MAAPLADLFVLFRVDGADTAEDALKRFDAAADGAGEGSKQMAATVKAGIAVIIEALAKVGEAMLRAMGVGQVAGESLDQSMELLQQGTTGAMKAVTASIAAIIEALARMGEAMVRVMGVSRVAVENFDKAMMKLRKDAADALGSLGKSADDGAKKPQGSLERLQGWIGGIAAAAQRTSQMVQTAFSQMSVSILGFSASIGGMVAAGVRFSYIGDQISIYLQRISLAMAGLFRPELEKAVNWLRQLTDWLYKLNETQRENIARWILTGAAMLTAALVIPKLIAGVTALISGVRALTATIVAGEIATGLGAIIPLVGIIAAGIVTWMGGIDGVTKAFAGLWEFISPLADGMRAIFASMGQVLAPVMTILGMLAEVAKPILDVFMQIGGVIMKVVAVGLQLVAGVLGMIAAILQPIVGLFAKMAEWLAKMSTAVLERVLSILSAITKAIAWLFGMEEEKEKKSDGKKRGPEAGKVGGPESITAAFDRMNVAMLNASAGVRDPQAEAAESLRGIHGNTARTAQAVERLQSPTTRN